MFCFVASNCFETPGANEMSGIRHVFMIERPCIWSLAGFEHLVTLELAEEHHVANKLLGLRP